VRKETSNALVFTIVCVPEDGTLIKDAEISARVLAVRLTLEMAKVVRCINEESQNVEQLTGTIGNVLGNTISIAELSGQSKVARELRNLKSLFSQKTEVALALANVAASSNKPFESKHAPRGLIPKPLYDLLDPFVTLNHLWPQHEVYVNRATMIKITLHKEIRSPATGKNNLRFILMESPTKLD